jgi:YegS/Rv2252/BmrU family lipid kinase
MKTLVVVNPNSANGSTGRQWPEIREALMEQIGSFEEKFTTATGHATDLVREGLSSGTELIICVGGDGTNNEVVNGFFDGTTPIRPEAVLGLVPRGTGGDLRKTLGIGKELSSCLPVLAGGHTLPADLGAVEFEDHQGQRVRRLFVNITSFGIGGLVDKKVNESTKALGGKTSFFIGTVKAMFAYRNKLVHLKVSSGGETVLDESLRINNVAVANGQYFGGGMWVAPRAKMDDGLFDVIILGDLTKRDVIFKGTHIYKGTHLKLDKVKMFRGSHVEATCEEEVLIDMDGEQPGRLPISLEVLPKAIRLIVPSGTPGGDGENRA